MVTLAAAYLIVWLAVAVYVVRLGAAQRRLERDLQRLGSRPAVADGSQKPTSDAA